MKMKLFSLAVANALLLLAASFVVAQDVPDPMAMSDGAPVADGGYGGKGCKGMLHCCCCDQSGWIFGAEATFFKYHRTDGVRYGGGNLDETQFDYNVSPRLTLGYVNCDGLGIRVRYWNYDQTANDGRSYIGGRHLHDRLRGVPAGPIGFLRLHLRPVQRRSSLRFLRRRDVQRSDGPLQRQLV